MRGMLAPKDRETGHRTIVVTGEQARDDGVDEQGVAAVDEEIELPQLAGGGHASQKPRARTSSRNFWTLRSLMSS